MARREREAEIIKIIKSLSKFTPSSSSIFPPCRMVVGCCWCCYCTYNCYIQRENGRVCIHTQTFVHNLHNIIHLLTYIFIMCFEKNGHDYYIQWKRWEKEKMCAEEKWRDAQLVFIYCRINFSFICYFSLFFTTLRLFYYFDCKVHS